LAYLIEQRTLVFREQIGRPVGITAGNRIKILDPDRVDPAGPGRACDDAYQDASHFGAALRHGAKTA
jgi:hypothetical protein